MVEPGGGTEGTACPGCEQSGADVSRIECSREETVVLALAVAVLLDVASPVAEAEAVCVLRWGGLSLGGTFCHGGGARMSAPGLPGRVDVLSGAVPNTLGPANAVTELNPDADAFVNVCTMPVNIAPLPRPVAGWPWPEPAAKELKLSVMIVLWEAESTFASEAACTETPNFARLGDAPGDCSWLTVGAPGPAAVPGTYRFTDSDGRAAGLRNPAAARLNGAELRLLLRMEDFPFAELETVAEIVEEALLELAEDEDAKAFIIKAFDQATSLLCIDGEPNSGTPRVAL